MTTIFFFFFWTLILYPEIIEQTTSWLNSITSLPIFPTYIIIMQIMSKCYYNYYSYYLKRAIILIHKHLKFKLWGAQTFAKTPASCIFFFLNRSPHLAFCWAPSQTDSISAPLCHCSLWATSLNQAKCPRDPSPLHSAHCSWYLLSMAWAHWRTQVRGCGQPP